MRLVYSVRNLEDLIYADELGGDALITYTREPPSGWKGPRGRIDRALIDASRDRRRDGVRVRLERVRRSRPSVFCSGAAGSPGRIRTERFGPST